ncbi:hypothetical protein CBS115989_780 [Aspergillus niger]|nr:hypothetical protein CBS115989_780 [Aspergillus niger]KAI2825522.1 hypothetical protein CBS133816_8383 [Aspergillus niger]KAI2842660.1 hypothetical protein CBS11350_5628 [Aspergillus niger]KAI2907759.1 hypothetical protein CBS147371_10577 [Aspergillus niger]KAI2925512.1 hypothetical protein CBS147320_6205 [Aspergillus niger]
MAAADPSHSVASSSGVGRSVVSLLTSHWTITPLSNGPTFITLIYCASCPPPDPGKQSPLSPQISCLDFRGLWQVLNFDLIED